jgi:hypothetical protein
MEKNIINFVLKLIGFSTVIFGIHYYVLLQFFEGKLIIPLWIIYGFNGLMVFIVISVLKHQSKNENKNLLNLFLILTMVKMVLILVLLLPLFFKKSEHIQLEVFNFFIPYFLFLAFEIFNLNKFFQKS